MGAGESWDILDAERRRTGVTMRRGDPFPPGAYHLLVGVWIRTADGRYVIAKRRETKRPFPSLWEAPGGCVLAGEASRDAAVREAGEEVGVDLAGLPAELVHSYRYDEYHHFCDIWLFRLPAGEPALRVQEEEVSEARMATAEELRELIRRGEFVPIHGGWTDKVLDRP